MKSIWILHEGNAKKTHDNALICLLIEHLSQSNPAISLDMVEFHGMGTKSNFFDSAHYPKLLKDGVATDRISKVLLVVDADYVADNAQYGGFDNTQKELNNVIAELGFESVCETYVMCDPTTKTGCLETFILSMVEPDRKKCLDDFLKCADQKDMKRILFGIYNIAYPKYKLKFETDSLDFSHPHFDELKNKLLALLGIHSGKFD
ncbi:MAG: hypothetical protein PHU06_09255 [Gallionella sp.]|nr:hypothetical protein [Gallionella sp.]MDD4959819.1 hypothetical protein [Gallionella sp.]